MDGFPGAPVEQETIELVARIQDGDPAAWEDLYRRYHDQLLLTVRFRLGRRLRGHLQSEDVFQSVALEALTALRRFEYRGPGSLNRFLQRLVVNKIRDRADTFSAQKRSGGVRLTDAALASLPDPASADGELGYLDAERYERLERCLLNLPDDLREVVILRKIDGLSSREVAEQLGRSDEAVRKSYSRGLARLTALMLEG